MRWSGVFNLLLLVWPLLAPSLWSKVKKKKKEHRGVWNDQISSFHNIEYIYRCSHDAWKQLSDSCASSEPPPSLSHTRAAAGAMSALHLPRPMEEASPSWVLPWMLGLIHVLLFPPIISSAHFSYHSLTLPCYYCYLYICLYYSEMDRQELCKMLEYNDKGAQRTPQGSSQSWKTALSCPTPLQNVAYFTPIIAKEISI